MGSELALELLRFSEEHRHHHLLTPPSPGVGPGVVLSSLGEQHFNHPILVDGLCLGGWWIDGLRRILQKRRAVKPVLRGVPENTQEATQQPKSTQSTISPRTEVWAS